MTTPIEKLVPQIVKALLTISPWPWSLGRPSGPPNVYAISDQTLQWNLAYKRKTNETDEYVNLRLMADSPLWLASLVVGIIQERARAYKLCDMAARQDRFDAKYLVEKERQALRDFPISQADYEEIKRRVDAKE